MFWVPRPPLRVRRCNGSVQSPMYLCICNALRESDVHAAAEAGIVSAAEYFRARGVEPQCGCCVDEVQSVLGSAAFAAAAE